MPKLKILNRPEYEEMMDLASDLIIRDARPNTKSGIRLMAVVKLLEYVESEYDRELLEPNADSELIAGEPQDL